MIFLSIFDEYRVRIVVLNGHFLVPKLCSCFFSRDFDYRGVLSTCNFLLLAVGLLSAGRVEPEPYG